MTLSDPKPFDWDFDGSCAPGRGHGWNTTFSVGIFQWVSRASGTGVKRGKVVKRISGTTDKPELVYAAAREWIANQEGK